MPDYDDSSKQLSLVHQAVVGDDAHTTELRHSDNPPHVPELSEDSGLPRPSSKADRLEFFLPISGFVWLYPEERAVVDHPAFQRLARIYQLGQSYFVFRGATHKRFEHVLGAVHVVQRMISAVGMNAEKLEKEASPFYAPKLSDYEERFVRLGTLLHDIGHIAAGHTVEDELGLVSKHDEDERLNIVINNSLNIKWLADSHGRSLGQLIDEEYALWTQKSGLEHAGFSASTLVRLLIRKPAKDSDIYSEIESYIMASDKFRLSSCRDMIGNTICADILDYIYRDWYHVGKPRPFDDRLLQYMELRRARTANPRFRTDIEADDQFVIFLGKPPKIRSDAVSHILELLEWRYSLAEIVLFHRTKLAAAAMLDRAFYELWGDGPGENEIIKFFLPLSDEEMLSKCYELAKERISKAKAADDKDRYQAALGLLISLMQRGLHKQLVTLLYSDLTVSQINKLKEIYSPLSIMGPKDSIGLGDKAPKERSQNASKQRYDVLRLLEKDFALTRGSLTMYCPAKMNHKIAEVKIAVGEEIQRLCDFEKQGSHDSELTGGHLDAQLRRFDHLWRVHFFIDPAERAKIGEERVGLLQMAIEKLALGNLSHDETPESVAQMIARSLISIDNSPWKDYSVIKHDVAAKAAPTGGYGRYPYGSPSIQVFLTQ